MDSFSSLISLDGILEAISAITLQIQQGRELEDILQWAIAETRRLLQTDRVLIYQSLANQCAIVAFESVGAEWSPILGQVIDDPCLLSTWIEPDPLGQTTPIADINGKSVDAYRCHHLEQWQAQANLAAPLWGQGKLWGLFVVHHCRGPREWQPLEVRYLQQVALHLGIAVQQAALRQAQQDLSARLQEYAVYQEPIAVKPESNRPTLSPEREAPCHFIACHLALQANYCALWNWDFRTQEVFFSPRWKALRGFADTDIGNAVEEWLGQVHPDDRDRVIQALQTHLGDRTTIFEQEYRVKHRDGSYRWVLNQGRGIWDDAGTPICIAGTETDITDRKYREELIQNIAQGVSARTGDAFFHSLVEYLIRLLDMDQVFVGELMAPIYDRIRMIAGLTNGKLLDGYEYPLHGTPCEGVVTQGFCIYPDSIQQRFPEDLALQAMGGEGYVGMPLISSSGTVIGIIGMISNHAIANVQFIQEVLTIFAVRAASELERQQSEALLRCYERIVSATPDCVSLIDRNYIYQAINQTYLTWHNKSADEIIGHSVSELLGQDFFEAVAQPLLDRCLTGESRHIVEAWQYYGDGERRFTRAVYAPYVELDGTVSGVVINVHDLTALKQAEVENQSLQERLQFLLAASPVAIYSCRLEGDFSCSFMSENVTALFGYTPAEFLAESDFWQTCIHPQDLPGVLARGASLLEQGHHTDEYRLRHRDGHYCWVRDEVRLVQNAAGKPIERVGCLMIIDDRKATEAALAETQQQYQTLIENFPDIIERFDLQLRHLYVSPSLTEITGIPAAVFQGRTCREMGIDTATVHIWETGVAAVLATGQKQIVEFDTPTLRGVRSFEMVIAPELSDQQTIESVLCISRDVTDRKTTEATLRQQQEFIETIAQSTLAILYVYDLVQQRNTYVNAQIESILGYSPAEIQAMGNRLFTTLLHPEDAPQQMAGYERCLTLGDHDVVETSYRMRHKHGGYRWLLSRDRVLSRTPTGVPQEILGVAVDVTVLKEAQFALNQQAERERLLKRITQNIRQTLDLDNILHTTVTEVRQFLQTDRVLIYQFEADWSGTVIAESVAAGWRSILGMHITDTYFVNAQSNAYQQGIVKATGDIYTANLDPCHVALLEQMQVRAKLVVPIVQASHLWGLLVAQHCQSPRLWEVWEIELQQQLATQIAIAIQQAALYRRAQLELIERQRAEASLQQLNQELEHRVQERTQALRHQAEQERLLRLIVQNIHRSLDLEVILTTVLDETRQTFKADRVAIYQFNADWSGCFVAESVGAGWLPLVQSAVKPVWRDTYLQETQGGRYRNNETFAVSDIYTIGHSQCHIDLLEQFQVRAYAIAPIFLDDTLWGLLAVYQNCGPHEWQGWEMSLLRQIGMQMAIALRQSHLYKTAQAQVKELERLSQLKDDFLSTVSHELRSPMSSVKMAIQMLEISLTPLGVFADESSAISRYFKILRDEGQREINLINDLLDLARLDARTEPLQLTPVALQYYIPHVAEPFIERTRQQQQQLMIEIPANLTPFTTELSYLERILTELLHNACKYTPAGETITVSVQSMLESLEIHVSNSGVEIPAAECDRIFDKFYRIPNNDPWKHGGTGLGLALVKKLTERLGGKIQVESGGNQATFILTFNVSP